MYIPKHFEGEEAQGREIMQAHSWALLTTADETGAPLCTHLVLQWEDDGSPHGSLIGHMARANPHWSHFGSGASLAVFHGPHAYVSPSWYAQPAIQVPTWNYAVVHVRGRARIVADRAATLATLQHMVARFEGGRAAPWRLQLEGARLDAMVGAIVAFEIEIERIDAKFKLSQNRDEADRRRVAAALRTEAYADATATADWMDREAGSE